MKKLLIFILFFVALGACTPKIIVENQDLQGTIMINSFEKSFSNEQFDSIAFSDSIPNDLKKWHALYLKDNEGIGFAQYMFIKKLGKGEIIYRLEKIGEDSVFITKRVIK